MSRWSKRVRWVRVGCALLAGATLCTLQSGDRGAAGAVSGKSPPPVSETGRPHRTPTAEIHVDAQRPAASDDNPGTPALPVKTVGRAAALALRDNATGTPVTVWIHPGTYREAVTLPGGGTSAGLTFQATQIGTAVISGSDLWTGWTRRAGGGLYTRRWPYIWGLAPIAPGWPPLPDIVRRREMIFVQGRLLTQVLGLDTLRPGTFFVDEAAHLVYMWPNSGVDPNAGTVEVAVRDVLFSASGRANLTLRGLVFQHAATPLDGSAVWVNAATGLLIDADTFRWNNWGGLAVDASRAGTIRRSVANFNGGRGMSDWKNKNLRYEDNETSYNNWRGAWGGFLGWTVAGIKSLRLHGGIFRRHKAVGNRAVGFWLDFDNQDVAIEDGVWCGNDGGAFIEASQGPITIARTVICSNTSDGLATSVSQDVVVRDSVLYDNGGGRQFAVNDLRSGTVDNWETGQEKSLRTERWTFCGDAFVAAHRGRPFWSVPDWAFFLGSLKSSHNIYWNRQGATLVSVRGLLLSRRVLDLREWQRMSGQDLDSVFADPRFADPARGDFTRRPSSPWRPCR